jgi:hypothetical protein
MREYPGYFTCEFIEPRGRLVLTEQLSSVLAYLIPFGSDEWYLRTSLAAWVLFLIPSVL